MVRVGVLKVDFQVTNSMSLKEKRLVMRSIKDRIRSNFNVSVAEVDNHDKWQLGTIAVSCVSNDKAHASGLLNKVRDFFERNRNIVVSDYQMEII